MAIIVNLDVVLAKRKMKSKYIAEIIGITTANLSVLKSGKAKAIRFLDFGSHLQSTRLLACRYFSVCKKITIVLSYSIVNVASPKRL